jgi:hypothetical protein
MAQTVNETKVVGRENMLNTYQKKEKSWFIFKVPYYELVNTEHLGTDIHIESDKEIREVYLNGKPLLNNQ